MTISMIKKTLEATSMKLYRNDSPRASLIPGKLKVIGMKMELNIAITRIKRSHQNFVGSFYLIVKLNLLLRDVKRSFSDLSFWITSDLVMSVDF